MGVRFEMGLTFRHGLSVWAATILIPFPAFYERGKRMPWTGSASYVLGTDGKGDEGGAVAAEVIAFPRLHRPLPALAFIEANGIGS